MKKETEDEFLEWWVEKFVVDALELDGWYSLKADKIKRGWPDQIFFGPDARLIIVEFKRTRAKKKRKGEKLQNHFRDELSKLGFDVRLVSGMKEATELVDELAMEGLK